MPTFRPLRIANGQFTPLAAPDTLGLTTAAIAEYATTPAATAGDLVRSTTTNADMVFDGTYWRSLKRGLVLKLCSADFTPAATGNDLGGLVTVPYDPNVTGRHSRTWTVTDIVFRCETPGSTITSVQIGRSTGTGVFTNAGYLNTTALSIAASAYEAPAPTLAVTSVNSNDKLMANYTALGTGAAGFTLYVVLCES